jgi:hypothetical protein
MPQQQKGLVIPPGLSPDLEVYDRLGCELVAAALRSGAHTRVRVMGTSMLPALWPGDILIARAQAFAPEPADIVLVLRSGRLFAQHKVVGSKPITRSIENPSSSTSFRKW